MKKDGKYYIIGVDSYGGSIDYPEVFMFLPHYMDMIVDVRKLIDGVSAKELKHKFNINFFPN